MNFASRILDACRAQPQRLALRAPAQQAHGNAAQTHPVQLTYAQFAAQVGGWQDALQRDGFRSGDRIVVLLPPSPALYSLLVAMLALGIAPVLIERGMSRQRIEQSLHASHASAVIGERTLLWRWFLLPALWRLRRYAVDGAAPGLRRLTANSPNTASAAKPVCIDLPADAHGIITFTSGSTGAPKGADRTHGSLIAQHLAIREHWPDIDSDIDCTFFPVLVLHNLCCGISTVLPDADLAAPAQANPAALAAQLAAEKITRFSAAPAVLARLVEHGRRNHITLPDVRSLIIGGATLPHALAAQAADVFPQAECRVIYGSTEAEPIADVTLTELARDWHAESGHLVGRPAHAATVVIVERDAALHNETDVEKATLPIRAVGEILVAGEHVLRAYLDNPQATRDSKIPRADGSVWHRTGDCGFFDASGRLWLTGRLKDAVTITQGGGESLRMDVFALEKAVDALPGVIRCALVQIATETPALIVSGDVDATDVRVVLTAFGLHDIAVRHIGNIPVDGRHNSKIDRPALRAWLEKFR